MSQVWFEFSLVDIHTRTVSSTNTIEHDPSNDTWPTMRNRTDWSLVLFSTCTQQEEENFVFFHHFSYFHHWCLTLWLKVKLILPVSLISPAYKHPVGRNIPKQWTMTTCDHSSFIRSSVVCSYHFQYSIEHWIALVNESGTYVPELH